MDTPKETCEKSAPERGLLTIGIPVFEEAEGLANTLTSISKLKEFKSGEIEVVVWDNASRDLSYTVASDFASTSQQRVMVGRNPSNLGAPENYRQLLRNATSKYVWFLGAGEVVACFSLLPLINFLGDPDNAAISMGTVGVEANSIRGGVPASKWEIQAFEPETESCFVETISLSIVNRKLALEVIDRNDPGKSDRNAVWQHLEIALAATQERTFTVRSPGIVRVSENITGWWYHSKNALGIYLNQVKLLKAHPRRVEWVQDRLADRTGWHFAKFAFEMQVEGAGLKPAELIEARTAGIKIGPLLVALTIALSPKPLLRIAQSVFRLLNRK
jgi:glycosyltransferase involved in cell wall biosynthesis